MTQAYKLMEQFRNEIEKEFAPGYFKESLSIGEVEASYFVTNHLDDDSKHEGLSLWDVLALRSRMKSIDILTLGMSEPDAKSSSKGSEIVMAITSNFHQELADAMKKQLEKIQDEYFYLQGKSEVIKLHTMNREVAEKLTKFSLSLKTRLGDTRGDQKTLLIDWMDASEEYHIYWKELVDKGVVSTRRQVDVIKLALDMFKVAIYG